MIPLNLSPLVDSITLPDDYNGETLELGWRRVAPDLRSRDGFRWPWPGQWTDFVEADTSDEECASGLHVAIGWAGASTTGPVHTALLVAFRPEDVAHRGYDKVRVRQALTLDVIGVPGIARNGYLTGADLTRANLSGANLTAADLTGADLTRAEADEHTVWPAGFSVPATVVAS